MTAARAFELIPLVALACLVGLGLGRGLALYARGVRVLVVDRERSPAEMLRDLAIVSCLLVWGYEIVAFAWPLALHVVPASLGAVVIDAAGLRLAGAALLVAGLAVYALALGSFGDSWRMGLDRDAPGALVTSGIFAWSRNPVYVGLDLLFAGTFLATGRLVFGLLALAMGGLLHAVIRAEERFLAETYGDAYRQYRARVGRYVRWPQPTPAE